MATRAPAIGIDLGTTFSCVGVYHDGKVKILQNEHGSRITPSVVGFIDDQVFVGEDAMRAAPESMIYDVKRLIGRRYNEETVQNDIKKWGFLVENENDKPMISVRQEDTQKLMHPEEISAMVLGKMKQMAEEETGQIIRKAVVTVPAYFDETQRQATKHAAKLAGLEPIRILSEPTAAAIAYELDHPSKKDINVLIYDLGGGTFDVSLLNIDYEIIEVLGTAGDTHLGGQDFVHNMVSMMTKKIKEELGKDVGTDKNALKRLYIACERAKIALSSELQSVVRVTGLMEAKDIKEVITRDMYEEMNKKYFDETLKSVQKVLDDAQIQKDEIHEVVLIGGATRTPYVRTLVQDYFDGKMPCLSINPDEAVAYGAAVMAAKLNRDWPIEGSLLMDVTALSLGIAVRNRAEPTKGKKMDKVVHRNSSLPTKKSKMYETSEDNQTRVSINIYQGELPYVKDNRLLGHFLLDGIPSAPKGTEKLEVTFNLDEDGILDVSAVHAKTGNKKDIVITRDKYHIDESEIKKKLRETQSYFKKNKNVYSKKGSTARELD